jgi:hypothetical protein
MAKRRAAAKKNKTKKRKSPKRRAAAQSAHRQGGRFAAKASSGRKHGGQRAADGRAWPVTATPDDRRELNLIYKKKLEDGYEEKDARSVALKVWREGKVYDEAMKEGGHREKLAAEKEGRELSYMASLLEKLKRRR